MTLAPLLATVENGVKILQINAPESRNSIGPEFFVAARRELESLAEQPEIGVVIFTGAQGFFSSGGNLNLLGEGRDRPDAERRARIDDLQSLVQQIRDTPVPVIAAVEGGAAGAGMSLALAADLLICAKDAFFAAAYVRAGLTPDGGLTASLAQTIPKQQLLAVCLLGERLPVTQFHQLGVVNHLTEPGEALAVAQQLAQHLAQGPPNAIRRILELGRGAYERSVADQLALETDLMVESQADPESGEGIAAVLGKRQPAFRAQQQA